MWQESQRSITRDAVAAFMHKRHQRSVDGARAGVLRERTRAALPGTRLGSRYNARESRGRKTHAARGLLLARQILDLPLPEEILASIDADYPVKNLVREARKRLSENEMPAPGLVEKTRFQIWSRERGGDKARYCALRLLTPSYEDCSPELPPSLSFLYYGVRPLRLLRDGLKRPASRPVV